MNILTFDTTFQKTYITLSKDSTVIDSSLIESDESKYHSAYLLSGIADLLRKNNLKMTDINKVATNIGPGSFTGIRVCTTAAKIISQQLNIDVWGFSSLDILSKLNKTKRDTVVVLDARRDNFYVGLYKEGEKNLLPLEIYPKEKMTEYASKADTYIICDSYSKKIIEEKGLKCFCFEEEAVDLGVCLAELAINKSHANNKESKWFNLNPLYIQPPPITLSSKK